MWNLKIIIAALLFGAISGLFGYFLKTFFEQRKKNNIDLKLQKMELEAEKKALDIIEGANKEKNRIIEFAQKEILNKENQNELERKRLREKEKFLEEFQQELKEQEKELEKKEIESKEIISNYQKKIREEIEFLEKISGISEKEAKNILFSKVEENYKKDLFLATKKLELEKKQLLEERAKELISLAIQKYSAEVNNSLVSTVVKIDSDDEKGKIIGKDGRNIRTFERLTGVQLIIDEGPEVVTISSFDPIRREIANRVLKQLLEDGIVQPAKIEGYYEKAVEDVVEIIRNKGEEAAKEAGVYNLHPELLEILGRLHFRTSYGQNVLRHSLEMVHIAGVIAEELGLNVSVVKAAALLHDIGKAVDFETEGTHVEIGRRILKQYNVDDEIIKAMQSHHKEYPNENLESFIIDAADAISAARPGARSDSAEMYIQKLEGLERITSEFAGVREAYALSAGREVRVFVKPDEVDDYLAQKMAREIAVKIEEELKYPGEIKVAVIREKRAITFAR